MYPPVDTVTDFLVSRYDFITTVSVDSLNPDLIPPADVIVTSTGVRAIVGKIINYQTASGDGVVELQTRDITVVATDLVTPLKSSDRINLSDGTNWIVDKITVGGYGNLNQCDGCYLQR